MPRSLPSHLVKVWVVMRVTVRSRVGVRVRVRVRVKQEKEWWD